jgi:hypothetical protein
MNMDLLHGISIRLPEYDIHNLSLISKRVNSDLSKINKDQFFWINRLRNMGLLIPGTYHNIQFICRFINKHRKDAISLAMIDGHHEIVDILLYNENNNIIYYSLPSVGLGDIINYFKQLFSPRISNDNYEILSNICKDGRISPKYYETLKLLLIHNDNMLASNPENKDLYSSKDLNMLKRICHLKNFNMIMMYFSLNPSILIQYFQECIFNEDFFPEKFKSIVITSMENTSIYLIDMGESDDITEDTVNFVNLINGMYTIGSLKNHGTQMGTYIFARKPIVDLPDYKIYLIYIRNQ